MKNPTKHINDLSNKPLCQKSNWIEESDSLTPNDIGLKESSCEECKRLFRKLKRVGRDKTRTYIYTMRELIQVWADELDSMTDDGLEPHRWMRYPKTEEIMQKIPLANRPDVAYFIDSLQAAIEPTLCKHTNKTEKDLDGRTILYTCSDCGYQQYRWTDVKEDDDYNQKVSHTFSAWERPRKKND